MPKLGYRKIAALLGLTVFLNLFLFHSIGIPVFILVTLGIWLFLLAIFINHGSWPKFKYLSLAASALLITNSLILLNRDYWLAYVLIIISLLTTLGFTTYLFASGLTFFRSIYEMLVSPLLLGLTYFFASLRLLFFTVLEAPALLKTKHLPYRTWISIGIGLMIGLPIIVVLIVLLSRADPIFNHFIQQVFNISLLQRLFFTLFILSVFSPLIILKRQTKIYSPIPQIESLALIHEFTVVMGLVALTLGSFLVVQAPYVFVNVPFETSLSQFGLNTYSEYVRRGFSELLLVGAIIYILVWVGLLMLRGQTAKRKQYLRYTQMFVFAEFAIFIISLFRRIWLYQAYHGLSLIRIYGGIFLLWLSCITLILVLRHFVKRKWVMAEVGITVIFVILTGLFNAEDFIARVHPPTVNKRIDYIYLSRMSADGYMGWKMAFDQAEKVLLQSGYLDKPLLDREDRREIAYSGRALAYLTFKYHNLIHKYASVEEWRRYNETIYSYLKSVLQKESDYLIYEPRVNNKYQIPYITGTLVTNPALIEKELKLLDERLNKLNQPQTYKKREINISFGILYNPTYFQNKPCDNQNIGVYCQYSIFWLDGETSTWDTFEPGTLDYTFAWNGSEFSAYEKMKQEMPIEKLLQMQQAYYSLYYKINGQPEAERDYDIDVSFNTPLLGD